MREDSRDFAAGVVPGPAHPPLPPPKSAMLVPQNALRILCRRTGGTISRATFYRWVSSGRIRSIRMGVRIFIPWPALEEFIRHCLEGE